MTSPSRRKRQTTAWSISAARTISSIVRAAGALGLVAALTSLAAAQQADGWQSRGAAPVQTSSTIQSDAGLKWVPFDTATAKSGGKPQSDRSTRAAAAPSSDSAIRVREPAGTARLSPVKMDAQGTATTKVVVRGVRLASAESPLGDLPEAPVVVEENDEPGSIHQPPTNVKLQPAAKPQPSPQPQQTPAMPRFISSPSDTAAPKANAPAESGSVLEQWGTPLKRDQETTTTTDLTAQEKQPGPNAGPGKEDECRPPKMRTIRDITTDIRPTSDRYPPECPIKKEQFVARCWEPMTYSWTASSLCHKPLYFEEPQLERYGHSVGPYAQPFVSGFHFFATVPLLPYYMGVYPPNECIYTLGYYRPGNCAPYLIEPFPLSVRGAIFEGLAWTAIPFIF